MKRNVLVFSGKFSVSHVFAVSDVYWICQGYFGCVRIVLAMSPILWLYQECIRNVLAVSGMF